MDLKAKVLSGLKWVAVLRVGGQVVSWVSTILVMRLLAPADYGLLAMAVVFVNMMQILAEGGIGLAVVQAARVGEHQLRQVLGLVTLVNGTLFVALFMAAPWIAAFFGEPRLTTIIRVLACPFLLTVLAAIPDAMLTRAMNFRAQSIVELSAAVVGACTTLASALQGLGVWSLVAGHLAVAVVRTVGLNLASPFLRLPLFGWEGTGALIRFGGHATLGKVLSFAYNQADTFIGGKLLGKELLGIYSVAREIASLPNAKLAGMINTISFSAFARIQDEPQRFASTLERVAKVLFMVVLPIGWGMSAVAEELVPVLLGEKWLAAIVPFKILALVMPLRLLATFINSANFGQGRADIVTWCVLAPAVIMIPGYLVGVHWGVAGLACAWAIGFSVSFLVILRIALPPAGVRVVSFLRGLAPILLCGVTMYALVSALRVVLPPYLHPGTALAVLVAGGALVFGLLVLLLARDLARDALSMLRQ